MKIILIVACACLLFSCKNTEDIEANMNNASSQPVVSVNPHENSAVAGMGSFTSYVHNLAGKCTLYVDSANIRILRFEDFNMSQGPDVYVFLSKANNYSEANVVQLARLGDGYSKASLHFNVDPTIDLSKYQFVLVYCVQYNSLFGYAELM